MSKTKIVLLITAIAIMLVAGYKVITTVLEYKQAQNEYDSLANYIREDSSTDAEEEKTESASEDAIVQDEPTKQLARNYNRNDFPKDGVDFDKLKEVNGDVVAWIYVGATGISYPVVQGNDNEYYLHHTFENKKNSSGCIFIDAGDKSDLTGYNTFFYGHNMKNRTMFGSLKQFIWNEGTYDKDHYVFVYRPGMIYRYEIFSYYVDSPDSEMYYTCDDLAAFESYLDTACAKSSGECVAQPSSDDNIITLVTCSGTGAGKKRFFIHATFVDRFIYPGYGE